jgi:alginate O-acetyltransferase complex protein AlgJ
VAHVAGPSFVDAEVIRSRVNDVSDDGPATPHPDPRPAVLDFHRALAARGIRLVVFPVPDKAALEAAELDGRGNRALPMPVPNNVGYAAFVDALRREGVAIFDPAPVLLAPGEKPRFLEQDTHWTPEWMQEVAADLARFVERVAPLPPAPKLSLRVTRERVGRVGDLVDMLKLPAGQTLFQPQHVTVQRVADDAGADWEPDPQGDVLLLGDSFTNIFSMDPMGWGTAAGLAPHLALALGRGVDVIAQNDSGAFATRQALARELGGGEDRLAGKRVVIWEFASRELSVGDWKPIDWSGRGARDARIEEGKR